MWEHFPGTSTTQLIEYAVEDFTHICCAWSATWFSWWYQRLKYLPFGIAQVTGIWFSFHNPSVYTIYLVSSTSQMRSKVFLPKWTELVVALYNTQPEHCYCEKLHRRTGMTVRHLRNLISDLESMNIIQRQCRKKIKYITLTGTGKRLAELLLQIHPELRR